MAHVPPLSRSLAAYAGGFFPTEHNSQWIIMIQLSVQTPNSVIEGTIS